MQSTRCEPSETSNISIKLTHLDMLHFSTKAKSGVESNDAFIFQLHSFAVGCVSEVEIVTRLNTSQYMTDRPIV